MPSPVKRTYFSLASDNLVKFDHIVFQHSPSLCKDLQNCVISPSFIWEGGKITLSLGTRLKIATWFSSTVRALRMGHSVFFQCRSRVILFHVHEKHKYLVKPSCWPNTCLESWNHHKWSNHDVLQNERQIFMVLL